MTLRTKEGFAISDSSAVNNSSVIKNETRYIAVWELILSAAMQAVFLVAGRWDYKVLLGNLLSAPFAVLTVSTDPESADYQKMQFFVREAVFELIVQCKQIIMDTSDKHHKIIYNGMHVFFSFRQPIIADDCEDTMKQMP